MRWSKVLLETDDNKLTFPEFLVQIAITGGGVLAIFLLVAWFG